MKFKDYFSIETDLDRLFKSMINTYDNMSCYDHSIGDIKQWKKNGINVPDYITCYSDWCYLKEFEQYHKKSNFYYDIKFAFDIFAHYEDNIVDCCITNHQTIKITFNNIDDIIPIHIEILKRCNWIKHKNFFILMP